MHSLISVLPEGFRELSVSPFRFFSVVVQLFLHVSEDMIVFGQNRQNPLVCAPSSDEQGPPRGENSIWGRKASKRAQEKKTMSDPQNPRKNTGGTLKP